MFTHNGSGIPVQASTPRGTHMVQDVLLGAVREGERV